MIINFRAFREGFQQALFMNLITEEQGVFGRPAQGRVFLLEKQSCVCLDVEKAWYARGSERRPVAGP